MDASKTSQESEIFRVCSAVPGNCRLQSTHSFRFESSFGTEGNGWRLNVTPGAGNASNGDDEIWKNIETSWQHSDISRVSKVITIIKQ